MVPLSCFLQRLGITSTGRPAIHFNGRNATRRVEGLWRCRSRICRTGIGITSAERLAIHIIDRMAASRDEVLSAFCSMPPSSNALLEQRAPSSIVFHDHWFLRRAMSYSVNVFLEQWINLRRQGWLRTRDAFPIRTANRLVPLVRAAYVYLFLVSSVWDL